MNKGFRRAAIAGAMLLGTMANARTSLAGTWAPLNHPPAVGAEVALLLTDGTVMVHVPNGQAWWRLTPDPGGSYVNGTWSQLASLPAGYAPLYFASAVLPDGRVLVEGGEGNNGVSADTNLGALYDPVTNRWTPISPPVGVANIGDVQSVILPNGRFMMAEWSNSFADVLFDPATLTWSTTGAGKADMNGEEGWTLLPSGKVLTVDRENGTQSELYDPSTGTWSLAGSTGQSLVDPNYGEIGPAMLLPDGRVFATGGTSHTAIFGTDGSWTGGPDFPVTSDGQVDAEDAPAALLPSGNVLVATSPGFCHTQTGLHFLEFDGTTFTEVPRTPNAPYHGSCEIRFLLLPTGQVLETDGSQDIEIYTPSGAPRASWAPAIASVGARLEPGATETLTGTQLNGLSQAVSYGDDAQAATNYPLVRVTNHATGHVVYFKTHDHSTMGVATGSQVVSTLFDIPAAAERGPSSLQVVANGIASPAASVCVTVDPSACGKCGGFIPDGCGGSLSCGPTLTGRACCHADGGYWATFPAPGHCVLE